MIKTILCFLVLYTSILQVTESFDVTPIVYTTSGRLQGLSFIRPDGLTINEFRGVPYAQPPTGDRRFKKPVPVIPTADLKDATKFAPTCVQHQHMKETINSLLDIDAERQVTFLTLKNLIFNHLKEKRKY